MFIEKSLYLIKENLVMVAKVNYILFKKLLNLNDIRKKFSLFS